MDIQWENSDSKYSGGWTADVEMEAYGLQPSLTVPSLSWKYQLKLPAVRCH